MRDQSIVTRDDPEGGGAVSNLDIANDQIGHPLIARLSHH